MRYFADADQEIGIKGIKGTHFKRAAGEAAVLVPSNLPKIKHCAPTTDGRSHEVLLKFGCRQKQIAALKGDGIAGHRGAPTGYYSEMVGRVATKFRP